MSNNTSLGRLGKQEETQDFSTGKKFFESFRVLLIRWPMKNVAYLSSTPGSGSNSSKILVAYYQARSSSQDIHSDSFTFAFSPPPPPPPQITQPCRGTDKHVVVPTNTSIIPTSSNQPLPLPLIHHPLTLVLALPFCSIGGIQQVVHITSHAAPASRRRRVNPLKRESRSGQLPSTFGVVRVVAAAIARVVAGSTACGRLVRRRRGRVAGGVG